MNNKFRICLTALLVILITGTWGSVAKAISPNVELEGNAKGIVFLSGDEPFLMKYNMLPGDTVERKMKLVNRYSDTYKIYLKAKRVSKKVEADLLSKIHLTVSYDNKQIYNGPVSGENDMIENIPLGSINPGEEKELYAKAVFDGRTMGNEFKNKYGEVEWIFTAVRMPAPKTGDPEENEEIPPNPNPPQKVVEPPKTIPRTPDTGIIPPIKVEIPPTKNEVPKKDVPEKIVDRNKMPKTGNALAGYIPYIAIGAILLGIILLVYSRYNKLSLKKEDRSNEK